MRTNIDSGGIRRFVVILVYNKLHTDAHTRLVQPTKTSEKMSGTLSLRFQRFVLSQPGCVAADSGSATATLHSAPSVPHAQDAHQFISTYAYTGSAVFPGIPSGLT